MSLYYPDYEWQKLQEKLKNLSLRNKYARKCIDTMNLREYAIIEKEIVSIGILNMVEILSKEKE
ncbi:MAG: hypothetical protein E7213_04980 [Clostridium sp.]|nr:hypothetical protein [Clostridium sp.]